MLIWSAYSYLISKVYTYRKSRYQWQKIYLKFHCSQKNNPRIWLLIPVALQIYGFFINNHSYVHIMLCIWWKILIVLTSCINFTVLNLDLIPMLAAAFINPWFLNFHWAAHSFISDPKVSNTFTKLKNKNIFASGFKNWRTSTTGFFSCWSL